MSLSAPCATADARGRWRLLAQPKRSNSAETTFSKIALLDERQRRLSTPYTRSTFSFSAFTFAGRIVLATRRDHAFLLHLEGIFERVHEMTREFARVVLGEGPFDDEIASEWRPDRGRGDYL